MTHAVVASPMRDSTRRLHHLIQGRDALRPMFDAARDNVADRFGDDAIDAWSAAVLQLIDVNAGPSCLLAFWDISKTPITRDGVAPLIACAQAAAQICRHAGAKAATSAITASATAQRLLRTPDAMARWWRIMAMLAEQAPESVEAVASRIVVMLPADGVDAFGDFRRQRLAQLIWQQRFDCRFRILPD